MTSGGDLGVYEMGTQLFGPERLADLDLSVHTIDVALRKADAATHAGSALDPPIMEGLNRWGLTTRYLRESLVAAKWSFDNPRNLARTIHPSGDFAVVVTTGDESTGLPHRTPGPKHPKGFATELAVLGNNQLALDLGPLVPTFRQDRAPAASPPRTWFLLFYADLDVFRTEVSLPECFADGRITKWAERILLPPIPRAARAAVPEVVRVEWTTIVQPDSIAELGGTPAPPA
jgi:hypothetical protein